MAAARSKKAEDILLLDLRKLAAFTDYFLICTGLSHPQLGAISDEIEQQLAKIGVVRARREGDRRSADWVLLDYGSFVVHVFAERARLYYDLERLWRAAPRIHVSESGAAGAPDSSAARS
ncbi:MAG: ribosome silencing factor [Acidobacteria bacterium]|nr:ribosome silencing factor [Acidobacteriota bacterium]